MDILLAFANNEDDPLYNLRHEDKEIFRVLTDRRSKKHFDITRISFADRDSLDEQLESSNEELKVFWFSGHAGADILCLEDGKANAKFLPMMLEKCSQLRLVVLNGCATHDQVEELLRLPSRPAVIATTAGVDDMAAAKFGISFFKKFTQEDCDIQSAYKKGLAAAQSTVSYDIESQRGLGPKRTKEPLWGLYGDSSAQSWKLPKIPRSRNLKRWLAFFIVISVSIFYLLAEARRNIIIEHDTNLINKRIAIKESGRYEKAIEGLSTAQKQMKTDSLRAKADTLKVIWEDIRLYVNEGDSLRTLYRGHVPGTFINIRQAIAKYERADQLDTDQYLKGKVAQAARIRDNRFREIVLHARQDIQGGRPCPQIIDKLEYALLLKPNQENNNGTLLQVVVNNAKSALQSEQPCAEVRADLDDKIIFSSDHEDTK